MLQIACRSLLSLIAAPSKLLSPNYCLCLLHCWTINRANRRLQHLGDSCVGQLVFREYCKSNPRLLDPLFKLQRLLRKVLKVDSEQWEVMEQRRMVLVAVSGRLLDVYEVTQAMAEHTGCPDDSIHEKQFISTRQFSETATAAKWRGDSITDDLLAEQYCEELVVKVDDVVFYTPGAGGGGGGSSSRGTSIDIDQDSPVVKALKQKPPTELSVKQLKMLLKPPKGVLPANSHMGFGMKNCRYDHAEEVKRLKSLVRIVHETDKDGKSGYVHKTPLGKHCCRNKMSKTIDEAVALVLRNHPQTWRDELLLYYTN